MMLVVAIGTGASPTSASSTLPTAGVTLHHEHQQAPAGGPQLVHGAIADVLVRVRGGAVCSGTPITGTRYVVTAAHCVLDRNGNAAARTIVRDGVTYPATAVLVDRRYFHEPKAQFDAAVLVTAHVLPGTWPPSELPYRPGARSRSPGSRQSTATTLCCEERGLHDVPVPKGATGKFIKIESMPAGCTVPTMSLTVTGNRVIDRLRIDPRRIRGRAVR